jgi:hypothetical protein
MSSTGIETMRTGIADTDPASHEQRVISSVAMQGKIPN